MHLSEVVNELAEGKPLDKKYRGHSLNGNYSGFKECYVEPDWLLLYRIGKNDLELFLFRTVSHADLF